MKEFYFTFGAGHHHKGGNLRNCYTIISSEDEGQARKIMHERRKGKWCTSYISKEQANIDKYQMTFVPFDKITQQNGDDY